MKMQKTRKGKEKEKIKLKNQLNKTENRQRHKEGKNNKGKHVPETSENRTEASGTTYPKLYLTVNRCEERLNVWSALGFGRL